MENYTLLDELEDYIEQAFGIKVEHAYDRRRVRRMFSRLSFEATDAARPQPSASAVDQWPPLDVFRSGFIQREALSALRIREPEDRQIANLLIPVSIRSDHAGITQKMFDSVVRSFFLHRYVRKNLTLSRMHEEFVTWLLFSLISDRAMIVETDFSHERNTALKYTVRPLDEKILRTPPVAKRINLFFSKEIATALKTSIYVGVHANISAIFNREIGYSDFEGMNDQGSFGPNASAGFLVIAGRRRDYSCAYIIPLYSLINRHSFVISRMQALFDTFMDILGSEAFYRIERNKHHSRLRHTIGVEVHHLTTNYDEIFEKKTRILDDFNGDKNELNIQLAKVNSLIHDLSRDVRNQLGAEFDIFGNRRSKRDEQAGRIIFSPAQFGELVKTVMRHAADKRKATPFLIELGHKALVEIASDSTLVICFTEIFNNAVKYNITAERIRIRTRDRSDAVIMTISNIGPALSKQESELMPLMGLRGMNSQRHVEEGSGQGLATVFSILEDIDVEAAYRQRALTKEQANRLASELGTKQLADLDLSTHIIELVFETANGEANE